jgi:dolichyl-phosphate beta-glucosyltransferase
MDVSLLIPIYNGEKYLLKTFEKLEKFCRTQKNVRQIIFINDGSTDSTQLVINDFIKKTTLNTFSVLWYKENKGKGYALQYAIKNTQNLSENIVFTDVEIPYGLECIQNGLKKMNEHIGIVIGDRTQAIGRQYSTYRYFFNRVFRFFIPKQVREIPDTQSGMKIFKREIAQKLFSNIKTLRWVFDLELLLMAKINNIGIDMIPVELEKKVETKSGVSFKKHSKEILKDLLKIYWYEKKGLYNFEKK